MAPWPYGTKGRGCVRIFFVEPAVSREGGSILIRLIFIAFGVLCAGANCCHRFRQSDQRQESLNNLTHQVCTAIKEVNAQWRGWASSQRGGARKDGVVKGSKTTPFSGLKGVKEEMTYYFIPDIHKSGRFTMETNVPRCSCTIIQSGAWRFLVSLDVALVLPPVIHPRLASHPGFFSRPPPPPY